VIYYIYNGYVKLTTDDIGSVDIAANTDSWLKDAIESAREIIDSFKITLESATKLTESSKNQHERSGPVYTNILISGVCIQSIA